jgi:hypothetical protein
MDGSQDESACCWHLFLGTFASARNPIAPHFVWSGFAVMRASLRRKLVVADSASVEHQGLPVVVERLDATEAAPFQATVADWASYPSVTAYRCAAPAESQNSLQLPALRLVLVSHLNVDLELRPTQNVLQAFGHCSVVRSCQHSSSRRGSKRDASRRSQTTWHCAIR